MAKTPGFWLEAEFATAVTIQPALLQQWRRGYHLFKPRKFKERIYYQDVRRHAYSHFSLTKIYYHDVFLTNSLLLVVGDA
jgi:hypothetical protein